MKIIAIFIVALIIVEVYIVAKDIINIIKYLHNDEND